MRLSSAQPGARACREALGGCSHLRSLTPMGRTRSSLQYRGLRPPRRWARHCEAKGCVENYRYLFFPLFNKCEVGLLWLVFFFSLVCAGICQRIFLNELKSSSAGSEQAVLQHSCGSGQRGPADPAGGVGQPGRAVPGLCPRGGGTSALSKRAGGELSSPGSPSSILCSSREPGTPPKMCRNPSPEPAPADTWLTAQHQLLFANSPASAGRSHPAQRDTVDAVTCSLTACGEGTAGATPAVCSLLPTCSNSDPLPSPAPAFLPASVSPKPGVV